MCDSVGTPKKRTHSDVEAHSSPEELENKRLNISKMEELKSTIDRMSEQLSTLAGIKDLCVAMKGTLDDLVQRVQASEEKCNQVMAELLVCKQENQLLKRKVAMLEEKSVHAESYSRRSNLVLDGIPYEEGEDVEVKVRQLFSVNMKVENAQNIQFVRLHRLPNKRKIIVRFEHFQDRMLVWQKRRMLKGTSIWIEEDFPKEIRNKRQVLQPIFRKAVKIPHVRASLVEDRLIINGQTFTTENLHMLPTALSLDQTSLVSHEDNIFFYSRCSPFSNFFPAGFNIGGIAYSCAEQRYQSAKADVHKATTLSDEILISNDPAEMHYIGHKKLKNDSNIWTEGKKLQVMKEAVYEKFRQNPHLKQVLLSTGSKQLVEAGPDHFWGAGVGMREIRNINNRWPGQNQLGKILMSVRQMLLQQN